MKFFKQVVLPIAVLVGLIGLVTYITHFRGTTPRGSRATFPTSTAPIPDE